jgi:hypothetical protein
MITNHVVILSSDGAGLFNPKKVITSTQNFGVGIITKKVYFNPKKLLSVLKIKQKDIYKHKTRQMMFMCNY